MLENSERSVRVVRMGEYGPLERAELANQIQGFKIPDRWDASEKNKQEYFTLCELIGAFFGFFGYFSFGFPSLFCAFACIV